MMRQARILWFSLCWLGGLSSLVADEIGVRQLVGFVSNSLTERSFKKDFDHQEVSQRLADTFIDSLDPERMFFLASDEEKLLKKGKRNFEQSLAGKTKFPRAAIKLLQKRIDENSKWIEELLEKDHDFSLNESMQLSYPAFPQTREAAKERWRKRIKYELLMESLGNPELVDARKFLQERYRTIEDRYKNITDYEMVTLYLRQLVSILDPDAGYFDERTLVQFRGGKSPPIDLGLDCAYRGNNLWITRAEPDAGEIRQKLVGTRIVAVSKPGAELIHLVGLPNGDALYTLTSKIGKLGFAKRIRLELDDPSTGARFSVLTDRWLPFR